MNFNEEHFNMENKISLFFFFFFFFLFFFFFFVNLCCCSCIVVVVFCCFYFWKSLFYPLDIQVLWKIKVFAINWFFFMRWLMHILQAFADAGRNWTTTLCRADSDDDGASNGEELGDPNCVWTVGATPARAATGHPGICEPLGSTRCANEVYKCGCKGRNCAKNLLI